MKKILAMTLAFVMLLSLGMSAYAAPTTSAGNLNNQLSLIYQNFSTLKQDDSPTVWFYTVTDLDHNGRLELMAAAIDNPLSGEARFKMWEVNQEGTALEVTSHENTGKDDLFVNLVTDSADTIYDAETRAWYYIFPVYADLSYDYTDENNAPNRANSSWNEVCGINKHGSHIDCGTLAIKNTVIRDNQVEITILDKDKNPITEDQYLNVVNTTFAGKQRSNTSFDWFRASEAASLDRFINSYSVFEGSKPLPQSVLAYNIPNTAMSLTVTKNPSNEYHNAGETAIFIVNAVNYTSLYWTFVDPSGAARTAQEFMNACGGSVGGQNGTDLYIYNVNTGMNGWGVYCTFQGNGGQTARTSTAYLYTRYDQNQLHNNRQNLEDFYRDAAYIFGTWVCPICGTEVWGDYCTLCGFDPDYYYTLIALGYVVDDDDDIPWYDGFDPEAYTDAEFLMTYGMTKDEFYAATYGYTGGNEPNYHVDEDDGYVPDWIEDGYDPFGVPDTADWYCPVCGSGCNGEVCWNCGFSLYEVVGDGYIDYDDFDDYFESDFDYDYDYDDYFDYDYDDIWDDDIQYALDWD